MILLTGIFIGRNLFPSLFCPLDCQDCSSAYPVLACMFHIDPLATLFWFVEIKAFQFYLQVILCNLDIAFFPGLPSLYF